VQVSFQKFPMRCVASDCPADRRPATG